MLPVADLPDAREAPAGYELVRRLPHPGGAEVWFALGPLGAPAMFKRSPADAAPSQRAVLSHEHDILQMLEVSGMPATPRVLDADLDAEPPWLALSWADGVNLVAWSRGPDRTLERRARVAERLVGTYVELHERGVLHGDPHPRNALVDEADRVRLTDFSAARLAEGPDAPAQAAQEQLAVAAAACRLVTGQSWLAPLQAPSGLGWPALERVLARATDPDPAGRWTSLWAFGRALSDVVALRPSA